MTQSTRTKWSTGFTDEHIHAFGPRDKETQMMNGHTHSIASDTATMTGATEGHSHTLPKRKVGTNEEILME